MRGGRRVVQPAPPKQQQLPQAPAAVVEAPSVVADESWRAWLEVGVSSWSEPSLRKALELSRTESERSVAHYAMGRLKKRQGASSFVEHFARSRVAPFEEFVLDLWEDKESLAAYLRAKLATFSPEEKTQRTMLCVWLFELYLDRGDVSSAVEVARQYPDAAHASTACELAASRRDEEYVLDRLADLSPVFEEALFTSRMFSGNYEDALKQSRPGEERAYDASATLFRCVPASTVRAFRDEAQFDAERLLPALLVSSSSRQRQQKNNAASLLISTSSSSRAVRLAALEQCAEDEIVEAVPQLETTYELQFALRLCSRKKMDRASVYLSKELGLYEEAASAAVERLDDVDLAKSIAASAEDEEVRRRIWLNIAKKVVGANVADSAALLEECPLLSIEDILPLCPDFVVIETFKNDIVKSLREYDAELDAIKAEMADYSRSVSTIRSEIGQLHERNVSVPRNAVCALTGKPVFAKDAGPFYYFSSGLAYLASSLKEKMVPHLPTEQKVRVESIVAQLDTAILSQDRREELEAQLDAIIARECPLTGDMMIDSVDEPLLNNDTDLEAWQL